MDESVIDIEMPERDPPIVIGDHQQPHHRWSSLLNQSPPQMLRGEGEGEEDEENLDELDLGDEFDNELDDDDDDDEWGDVLDDDEIG